MFLLVFLLLMWISGFCSNRSGCRINDGDVEYLNIISSEIILVSRDSNVVLPDPYTYYDIPDISNVVVNKYKVGKALNICPPVALIDNLNE